MIMFGTNTAFGFPVGKPLCFYCLYVSGQLAAVDVSW